MRLRSLQVGQVQSINIYVANDGDYTQWPSVHSQCGSAVADALTNSSVGVCIHWTGTLDWTTRVNYWTDFLRIAANYINSNVCVTYIEDSANLREIKL